MAAWSRLFKLWFFLFSNISSSYLLSRRVSLATSCQLLPYTSYWSSLQNLLSLAYEKILLNLEPCCHINSTWGSIILKSRFVSTIFIKLHVVLCHRIFNVIIISGRLIINVNWLVLLHHPAIHIHNALIIHWLASMKKTSKVWVEMRFDIPYRTCCIHVLIVGDMNSKNLELSFLALFFRRKKSSKSWWIIIPWCGISSTRGNISKSLPCRPLCTHPVICRPLENFSSYKDFS